MNDGITDGRNLTEVIGAPAQGKVEVRRGKSISRGEVDPAAAGTRIGVVSTTVCISDDGRGREGSDEYVSCIFGLSLLQFAT